MSAPRRALVLGGYGLIGHAVMRALARAGFAVAGAGRSQAAALAADPDADWRIHDLSRLTVAQWRSLLMGFDVVVNASGALQDGARDDLTAIHVTAIARLLDAEPTQRLVQISAAGVSATATGAFFRTKAKGDALIAARAREWVILRPVMVLAPAAYGGSALLRAAAALPGIVPRAFERAEVQTLAIDDLAEAVVAAAEGRIASGTCADLTGDGTQSLFALTLRMRMWLGLPPPRVTPRLPDALLALVGRGADALGWLGWRSPLRSNALAALAQGVRGDPAAWHAAGGNRCLGLDATLARMPATAQDRLHARLFLALPVAIATLALFWLATGLVALARVPEAAALLTPAGMGHGAAEALVIGGALADMLVGAAILMRRWTRVAAAGMVVLSLAYLAGSLALRPDLWLDPLGPMLKVLPGMVLAAMVGWLMESR